MTGLDDALEVVSREEPEQTSAVVPRQETTSAVAVRINEADIIALKNVLDPSMTDPELRLLAAYATRTGLDPISKQIYSSHIDGRQVIMTAIDGFRVIAERSGRYRGQGTPVLGDNCTCGVPRYGAHPEWGEVPVYREGFEHPIVRRAYFHEYVPTPKGWVPGGNFPQGWGRDSMWLKMPRNMILKCAEALALRVAFPNDLGSMYTAEEMEQAEARNVTVTTPGPAGELPAESSGGASPSSTEHGLPWSGPVYKVSKGVRRVKTPKWAKDITEESVPKAEVAFKISNRRHTAIILGELAFAVDEAKIENDETVACDGEKVELDYPNRGDKPMKKELHNVTRIMVMRGGEWLSIEAPKPEAQPAEDVVEGQAREVPPDETANVPAEPPADPTPEPPASDAPTPPSEPSPTTSSSDSGASSEDGLPDADVDPGRGGQTELPEPAEAPVVMSTEAQADAMKLPVWQNEADRPMDDEATIILMESDQTPKGKAYTRFWLREKDGKVRFEGVLNDDEAKAQKVSELVAGQVVRVVGTWAKLGPRAIVILTAVAPAG